MGAPIDKSTISYGLNAIKNVGEKALESIIENREKEGPFKSIFDFCSRIDQQKVNKRVLVHVCSLFVGLFLNKNQI